MRELLRFIAGLIVNLELAKRELLRFAKKKIIIGNLELAKRELLRFSLRFHRVRLLSDSIDLKIPFDHGL